MVEFDECTGKSSRWNPENWTQPVFVKTARGLISRMDDKRSKVFNAHQVKFGSQWLNVVPCKNLGLKLDDQQLRISIALRLGANNSVADTCHCGKRVERDAVQSFLHQECWSLLTSCYFQFSHKADVGISRLAFNARTAWTTEPMANAQTVLPWFLGKWVNSWCGMSRLWMLLNPVAWIKALYVTGEQPPPWLKRVKLNIAN